MDNNPTSGYATVFCCAFLCYAMAGCCPQKDYHEIQLSSYEQAAEVLTKKKDNILEFRKELNPDGPGFVFQVGKKEFEQIVDRTKDDELKEVLKLWDKGLLQDSPRALWFLQNGNIYFKVDECRSANDFVVYDGGEELLIDAQSDIRKYRIKPQWVYTRMMK